MRKPSLRARKVDPAKQPKAPAPAPTTLAPSISHEARENLPRSAKLADLERQLKLTRTSTASLGKYDKKLDGEAAREKGVRRQFESNEIDTSTEREKYLAVLNGLDNDEKVKKRIKGLSEHSDVLNARKAIRSASKGKGSASLAGEEKRNKIKDKKAALGKLSNKSSSSSSGKASKSSKGGGSGKTKSSTTKGKRKGK